MRLSPEQAAYRLDVFATRQRLRQDTARLQRLVAECPHAFDPELRYAVCWLCGEGFGICCPDAPDSPPVCLLGAPPADGSPRVCVYCKRPEVRP